LKWDVKIALYLFLAYALYGLSYLISDGDYVVPLPMLYIFIPIVSLAFLFTSGINKYTIFFLLLPLTVMSDKISQYNPGLSGVLVLASIVSWVVLGFLLIFNKEYIKASKSNITLIFFPVICLLTPLFLIDNSILIYALFFLIGILAGLIVREDGGKYELNIPERRLMILSSFTAWMYLITALSFYTA